MTDRLSWDDLFLNVARAVAGRADCTRRQVGAVIVGEGHRVIGMGYNGAPSGDPGCASEGACPRGRSGVAPMSSYDTGEGSCIAVHAEVNAIMYSNWEPRQGAILYCTDYPCDGCYRIVRGSGIRRIVWPEGSEDLA